LDDDAHSGRLQPGSAAQIDRSRDMLDPAYLQIDNVGGEMAFGAVQIRLQCEYGTTWFKFHGSDEMTEVSGDGDAELEENGTLNGEIRFDNGDESSFIAIRW